MRYTIEKYLNKELNITETKSLFESIEEDKDLKDEFARLQNIHSLSQLSPLYIDKEEGREAFKSFNKKIKKNNAKTSFVNKVFKYAAISIIIITSTFFTTRFFYDNSYNNQVLNTLYVPAGQRAKVTLQDGSTVWVNANSTLKYPSKFSRKHRDVIIEGEAFFDINEDKKRPFVVSAKNVKMKVLGTQFNVHSYPETDFVRTDLIEGSLYVYKEDSQIDGVTLKPNEQVTVSDNSILLSETPRNDYFMWIDGMYTFENEKLIDILEKFQLYYDVKIIVEDPDIFNVTYTGKFRQKDGIDEILRIIQKIRNFNIIKDIENNIITLTK